MSKQSIASKVPSDSGGYSALILGASGLVGQTLTTRLLNDPRYTSVTCLVRRPMASCSSKHHPVVIEFDNLQAYEGYFRVDHLYICLGTTLKSAGSKEAFRKVDFEYVHIAAQLARSQQVTSLVWISSVGADARSRSFYLRTKGELENAIFRIPGIKGASAVRPSLLLGNRKSSRPAEQWGIRLMRWLSPLLIGRWSKYRPVSATEVAKRMMELQQFD
ncbi:NAD-dependent epimerase/dehydratase family protein [Lacimicrobium alkaliphilum]|uniref:Oxidoreductase n=1 Tax=Lacimicrobium alkaliphilum TaxID=1526571 RepID=A0ABQ1QY64_9ALTE|nr:NAD-dependent epimerase/dehydratase family protein [Lacimicrobium alkaliphilum]GGD49742.1 oxidoreductase [Lacimicrobium alkaliphilum]